MKRTAAVLAVLMMFSGSLFADAADPAKSDAGSEVPKSDFTAYNPAKEQKGAISGSFYSAFQLNADKNGNFSWGPDWWPSGYGGSGPVGMYTLEFGGGSKSSIHLSGSFALAELQYNKPLADAGSNGGSVSQAYMKQVLPGDVALKFGLVSDGLALRGWGGWGISTLWTPADSDFQVGAFYPVYYSRFKQSNGTNIDNFSPIVEAAKDVSGIVSYRINDMFTVSTGSLSATSTQPASVSNSNPASLAAYGNLAQYDNTDQNNPKLTLSHYARNVFVDLATRIQGFNDTNVQLAYTDKNLTLTSEQGGAQSGGGANGNASYSVKLQAHTKYTNGPLGLEVSTTNDYWLPWTNTVGVNSYSFGGFVDSNLAITPSYHIDQSLFGFELNPQLGTSIGFDTRSARFTYGVSPQVGIPFLQGLTVGYSYTGVVNPTSTDSANSWTAYLSYGLWLGF